MEIYNCIIVTNNPAAVKWFGERNDIRFEKSSFIEVLMRARDLTAKGHELITHPLAGNLGPEKTPYKSIALSKASEGDLDSISLIDKCIKFCSDAVECAWDYPVYVLEDLQMIDCRLVSAALER